VAGQGNPEPGQRFLLDLTVSHASPEFGYNIRAALVTFWKELR
jgi:hypothetical protein